MQTFETSGKVGLKVRAKALGFLLLPFLVLAVVVALGFALQRRIDSQATVPATKNNEDSMRVSQAPAAGGGTSYVVTGKY